MREYMQLSHQAVIRTKRHLFIFEYYSENIFFFFSHENIFVLC